MNDQNQTSNDLRRSARQTKRIDYKEFNQTGVIKEVQFSEETVATDFENIIDNTNISNNEGNCIDNTLIDNTDPDIDVQEISNLLNNFNILSPYATMDQEKISQLQTEQATLADDINDFLDENNLNDNIHDIEDIESCVCRIEQLRSKYRRVHKDLSKLIDNYEVNYGKEFLETIASVKCYIKEANTRKGMIRQTQKEADIEKKDSERKIEVQNQIKKNEACQFQINEINQLMKELNEEFKIKPDEIEDGHLLQMKKEIKENNNKMDRLSSRIKDLLSLTQTWDLEQEEAIRNISADYQHLTTRKNEYCSSIKEECSRRELTKEESFKTSNLNIKLQKFRGYESSADIYTFKSEFEKVYSRSTPRRMLPDVLKNNFLEDPALSMVKSLDDINEIWKRLITIYGDPKMMLHKKMSTLTNFTPLWKTSNSEKTSDALIKIINLIKDLMNLAEKHNIKEKLYNGDGLERIYNLLGDSRLIRWLTKSSEDELEGKEQWSKLIEFLEKEARVHQQRSLIQRTNFKAIPSKKEDQFDNKKGYRGSSHIADGKIQKICSFCGESDHVATNGPNQSKIIQYFSCRTFVEMTPKYRFAELQKKGFCFQCLYPGADKNTGKHKDGHCQTDFVCKHPSHDKFTKKKHVLVCEEHSQTNENKQLLEEYKSRCILKQKANLPEYSKDIKLSFHASNSVHLNNKHQQTNHSTNSSCDIQDKAIYILQTIDINNQQYNIFYDSGCGDMVSRYSAIKRLGKRAKQDYRGPVQLGGVGGVKAESKYGIYQVKLPLCSGSDAILSGVCLEKITESFPTYPLQGKVMQDIISSYKNSGGNPSDLPKVPVSVGGNIDFMIGIKYLRHHPKLIYQLPSGLSIYESMFRNSDGTRGVIGGPHEVFTKIEEQFRSNVSNTFNSKSFLSQQFELYRKGYHIEPDFDFINFKSSKNPDIDFEVSKDIETCMIIEEIPIKDSLQTDSLVIRSEKAFNLVENAASEITYRCVNCRNCKQCKDDEKTEVISIKEEIEQNLINKSVTVDIENRICTANLPVIHNPLNKLAPNKNKALAIYNQQVKKLEKNPKDKQDVITSEAKLHALGHVCYTKDLSIELQKMLQEHPVQNYIPWRAVWKESSLSTPCRVVFDASSNTGSGYSLNDILAKGRNNMNKLVEIFIRWTTHAAALHTDVQKMYNTVKLQKEDWCLQRYLWEENLEPSKFPQQKIIKTLIYGIKSSGNQAEYALRKTALASKSEYPEANRVIQKDVYVDDCLSGANSKEKVTQLADEIQIILSRGGFTLKGFTFSGESPSESLSGDNKSINVAGMKWYPEDDKLELDITELNFNKKHRGKKLQSLERNAIPKHLTRRQCVSKVAEIYDLVGKITPLTAMMKCDLHDLVTRKLDWDDKIPDSLRHVWESHFELIQNIKGIKFNRAVVPADAISLDIDTIDTGDASKHLACAAIYARFKRKTGKYSCQLIFSRSKLIPQDMSQPRAELFAATLNAHTGEIVKRSLQTYHKSSIKLTDSQIVLHWLHNENKQLKQWTRNRVIEIHRFADKSLWRYISSTDMIADIGTRRGATLDDVNAESEWINGFPWMKLDVAEFPTKTIEEIKLDQQEINAINTETQIKSIQTTDVIEESSTYMAHYKLDSDQIKKRYTYSQYLVDPNRHRFNTVVRIIAIIKRFIHKLKQKVNLQKRTSNEEKSSTADIQALQQPTSDTKTRVILSEEELKNAENYFFKKATEEIKHFLRENQYKRISKEKDGILYYTGRILPNQNVTVVGRMTNVMKDLQQTSFCVPIIDKYSPLAYSIVNEIHWYNNIAKHAGIETVLRCTLSIAYIIEGREIVKKFKKDCHRCRLLAKRTIEVSMGPVSTYNLTIAPAFYYTQVDLAGPFKAYTFHNKRKTIKIWLCVFCCSTTSMVSIKVMEDYSSSSFVQCFIRLSCEVGYPKKLLPDEGSQLITGCESMKIDFQDTRFQLHQQMNVEYEQCPTAAHHMHGKVERKIRQIKESIQRTVMNERLSVLQWETLAAEISNSINNLPLAVGNITGDLENLDLITPNRLRLGRNNNRSPTGPLTVINNPKTMLKCNEEIFNAWFENWLITHVPKLMHQPKWFDNERDVKEDDIILFLKNEGALKNTYQFGKIKEIERSQDNRIRKVTITYRNHNESINRETRRGVRHIVMIHPVDETNIVTELGEIATSADVSYKIASKC